MDDGRWAAAWASAAGAVGAVIANVLESTPLAQPAALAAVYAWVLAAMQPNARFLRLPWLAYLATGQGQPPSGHYDPHRAAPVAAAWHLLHCAARLLDETEDGDESSLAASLDPAQIINAATGLIFASQLALASLRDLGLDARRTLELVVAFNTAASRMVGGQAEDLALISGPMTTLDHLRGVQEAKSGEFFALSCRAGAMLGDASADEVAACATFGYNLGMLVQIGDDLRDVWMPRSAGELGTARCTLPVVYALSMVDDDARQRIEILLDSLTEDSTARARLQGALAASGAPHYATLLAGRYYAEARQALLSLSRPSEAQYEMLQLLDQVFPAVAMKK